MLDTLSMVKKLKTAGVPEPQAEAQVAMVVEFARVFEIAEKHFMTKADLRAPQQGITDIKTELKVCATKEDLKGLLTKEDLKGLLTKEDLKAWAKNLESRLMIRLGGLIVLSMSMGYLFLRLVLQR
ncbi:MAG: hypothetical protein ACYCRH_08180 [Acidiferrobacteraceae bacterium]